MKTVQLLIALIFVVNSTCSQIDSSRFFKLSNQTNCLIYDLYCSNEIKYEWGGKCIDGYASGKGVCKFIYDETVAGTLEGDFIKGVPEGECTYKLLLNETVFKCNYTNGRMCGIGNYSNSNGSSYVGEMRDVQLHGYGKMIYTNGTIFSGIFNKSKIWTGSFTDLKEDTSFFYLGKPIDVLPKPKKYSPLLHQELTEYFDEFWNRCEKNIAIFCRKITYEKNNIPKGIVRDFYISGALYRKYKISFIDYSDESMNFLDAGPYLEYFENGTINKDFQINYLGNYSGAAKSYHEEGSLKTICNFDIYGKLEGSRVDYDQKNKMIDYAIYDSGKLKNGKYFHITEDGFWENTYNEDFALSLDFWNGDAEKKVADIIDDKLYLNLKSSNFYFRTKVLDVNKDDDFSFSCGISTQKKEFKKDDYLGILFDYKNENNYCLFYVTGKNIARVVRFSHGTSRIEAEQKIENDNLIINDDICDYLFFIGFYTEGIRFSVNGQAIHKMVEWDWQGDEFGLVLNGKYDCVIDYIQTVEYYNSEDSKGFTDYVENKVLNDNSSEYDFSGSGFFISRQGHIVTNYHVVEGAEKIDVKINSNGKEEIFSAQVLVQDKINDLAIIKIESKDFDLGKDVPYNLDFSIKDVGTEIFTLGYPMIDLMGSEIKFTDGKISSKTGLEGDIRTYQISAPIQPGNSGGPLFDNQGSIIGVVSSTLNRDYNAENVNFALKSNLIKNLIDASPEKIVLSNIKENSKESLVDKIKVYKQFVPLILIKE
jgi:S1-C subfamily serine protease